ncbi:MAG: C25 family peptidase propeptide domain-containing protein [Thermoplasmata archaeon]
MKQKRKWIGLKEDVRKGARVPGETSMNKRKKKISVTYEVKGIWEGKFTYDGIEYDTIDVPDAGRMTDTGAPMIPQEGLFVAIPMNANVKGVEVKSKSENDLKGKYHLLPAPEATVEGKEDRYEPDPDIYESDEPFPGRYVDIVGEEVIESTKVVHLMVFLCQYKPRSRKVKMLENIDLEVSYTVTKEKVRKRARITEEVKDLVLNWENVAPMEKGDLNE